MSTAFILASTSQGKNLLELVGVLIIFVFVLLITYLTTKWMGGFQKAKFKNRNMQILETISIGNNKTVIAKMKLPTQYVFLIFFLMFPYFFNPLSLIFDKIS